jgi:uncharacterized iron-regulated protein
MTRLRDQLFQIQKRNYRENVKLVRESLGHRPSIKTYGKEYSRYLKTYESVSDKTELIKKVMTADVVFHGDYHTLLQSKLSVLSILREIRGKRDVILCLEMFHGDDQKHVNRFMAGELPEKKFLEKIDYKNKWPFRWSSWQPIISFCRENKIPILGINVETDNRKGLAGLRQRDVYSARIITKTLIRNPGKLVYVVDGDFHVSPNHLPKEVRHLMRLLDEPVRELIIFQNVENLYWKLFKERLEETDVIKIKENMYCVMNTLPANKIQSYLNWLEYSEDAYFPLSQDWEDDAFEGRGLTVTEIINILVSVLQLQLPSDAMESLTVYYPNNMDFMKFVHETREFKGRIRLIKDKMKRGEGFLLEFAREDVDTYAIYLPNSNINMAAEEACHFVNAVLRGPLKKAISSFDRFYRNVITECIGFFGSKFINEKRQSESEASLRRFLGQVKRGEYARVDPEETQVARYILQHLHLQKKDTQSDAFIEKFQELYNSTSRSIRMFSTQLGYMLGNKLYYRVKRGRFSLKRIRAIFHNAFDEPMSAFDCYIEISERVKKSR